MCFFPALEGPWVVDSEALDFLRPIFEHNLEYTASTHFSNKSPGGGEDARESDPKLL